MKANSSGFSHPATATKTLPLTRDDVLDALAGYLDTAGFEPVVRAELAAEVDDMLQMVGAWLEGDVIERRIEILRPR